MKYLSSLVFIFLFSLQSFSQKRPGYIVLNNGDTLKGKIKRTGPFNDKPAFTVYDSLDKGQKIMETEAIAFGWIKNNEQEDYARFKIKLAPQPYAFFKMITKGKISVFETYIYQRNSQQYIFYFKSLDEKIYTLNFSDLFNKKKVLSEIFTDCSSVLEKIKGEITPEKVLKWVEEYNNCNTAPAN